MGLFGKSTNPFDECVEAATAETNVSEDWSAILEICDKIKDRDAAKDVLNSIKKRLEHKVPLVGLQALTLLDALVKNCDRFLKLEIANQSFCLFLKDRNSKAHPKVSEKLRELIRKWAEGDFKDEMSFSQIPSLYHSLRVEGYDFPKDSTLSNAGPGTGIGAASVVPVSQPKSTSSYQTKKEEDDLAEAIKRSILDEEQKKSKKTTSTSKTKDSGNLYSNILSGAYVNPSSSSNLPSASSYTEYRSVRALYDFEGVESDELTFKAGDSITVLDDSDPNWWKGSTTRMVGLFPANFVTADLNQQIEPEVVESQKTVQFDSNVEVKTIEPVTEVTISEDKIDKLLTLLQNSDPTGEEGDSPELLVLEDEVMKMGPLIDEELEKIDKKHASLTDLNVDVMGALKLYHELMQKPTVQQPPMMRPPPYNPPGQPMWYPQQSGPSYMMPGPVPLQAAAMYQPGMESFPAQPHPMVSAATYPGGPQPQQAFGPPPPTTAEAPIQPSSQVPLPEANQSNHNINSNNLASFPSASVQQIPQGLAVQQPVATQIQTMQPKVEMLIAGPESQVPYSTSGMSDTSSSITQGFPQFQQYGGQSSSAPIVSNGPMASTAQMHVHPDMYHNMPMQNPEGYYPQQLFSPQQFQYSMPPGIHQEPQAPVYSSPPPSYQQLPTSQQLY